MTKMYSKMEIKDIAFKTIENIVYDYAGDKDTIRIIDGIVSLVSELKGEYFTKDDVAVAAMNMICNEINLCDFDSNHVAAFVSGAVSLCEELEYREAVS